MSDNRVNYAKCNRCRWKFGKYESYNLHTIHNRESVRIGDILLCNECAKELLMDSESATEHHG
jgi:hypothetical protein